MEAKLWLKNKGGRSRKRGRKLSGADCELGGRLFHLLFSLWELFCAADRGKRIQENKQYKGEAA